MSRLINRLGGRTVLALALLAAMLVLVSAALNSVVRGLDLQLALTITGAGLLVGWLLARTPLPGAFAAILIPVFGIEIIFTRVGQLGGKLFALMGALSDWMGELLRAPWHPPSSQAVTTTGAALVDALVTITSRAMDWARAMAAGTPSFDPVAVALVWSLALWLLATWAAWAAFRRYQPFAATLPLIAFVAMWLAYSGASSVYLLPMVGLALVLIVVVHQTARERDWERRSVDSAEDIPSDVGMSTAPLIALLVIAAALIPSFSVRDLIENGGRFLEVPVLESNRVPDSFGLQPAPRPTTVFDTVRAPGLPRQHLLGAGAELSKRVVMTIQTDDPEPRAYYWRSTTYDSYTGRGWATSGSEVRDYGAGQHTTDILPNERLLGQRVQIVENPGGLLYAAGRVAAVDHDYRIAWRSGEDVFSGSLRAASYRVDSYVPNVSEVELRATGTDYAAWVQERYFTAIEAPERVLALARDLTATARTPYDRAKAIESYLREVPYTLDVPAPPVGRDVVDYYLFELKQGYCDYAASAMVVLARAAGLPARLVVGYASGMYDDEMQQYVVTEASAHSWVDIYFPEYGWIEFEPTGGRPPIDRSGEVRLPEPRNKPATFPLAPIQSEPPNVPLAVAGAMGVLVLAALGMWGVDNWRLYHLSPDRRVGAVFARLTRWARRLGIPVHAAHTPAEVAALVAQCACGDGSRTGNILRAMLNPIAELTNLYTRACYSESHARPADGETALHLWRQMRWRLWAAWMLKRMSR